MKTFLINILIILSAVVVLIATTALLEFNFFTKYLERRILVIVIQLIEIWVFYRMIVEFNNSKTNE